LEGSLSFHNVNNGLVNPGLLITEVPSNYEALQGLQDLDGDCLKSSEDKACRHVLSEGWSGQMNTWSEALKDGYIEPPKGNGMVGKVSFMIPTHTAKQDPSLASFHGLHDQKEMAETFLRPTSWYDYCNIVTSNHCTTSDEVAQQFLLTDDESESYFVDGLYIGHFQKSNCTLHPNMCSGHVIHCPCEWDTLTESQMVWKNISLT
jgi:hypothetical protein